MFTTTSGNNIAAVHIMTTIDCTVHNNLVVDVFGVISPYPQEDIVTAEKYTQSMNECSLMLLNDS